jgi:hypothetical protein
MKLSHGPNILSVCEGDSPRKARIYQNKKEGGKGCKVITVVNAIYGEIKMSIILRRH